MHPCAATRTDNRFQCHRSPNGVHEQYDYLQLNPTAD